MYIVLLSRLVARFHRLSTEMAVMQDTVTVFGELPETHIVSAPAVYYDTMQPIRRSRGVSLYQWLNYSA